MPLMHRSLTFHMQDSGQYSISAEAASSLQVEAIDKIVYVKVTQIRIL